MSENHYNLVIGGSSGVGRALVQELVAREESVMVVARHQRDLKALQEDCYIRYGKSIKINEIDVQASEFDANKFLENCHKEINCFKKIFIPLGVIDEEDRGVPRTDLIERLNKVNYLRPAQIISAYCNRFRKSDGGQIIIFTSITTAAPRGNNIAYASAKMALEFYCQALQHYFAESKTKIIICALGYVDTSMSFGLELKFPMVSPEKAAIFVLQMSDRNKRFAYFPRYWWFVTMLLRFMPWFLYSRLKF